jgi:probable HAF family extracellular repeat protein
LALASVLPADAALPSAGQASKMPVIIGYRVTQLGTLGGDSSEVLAMNDRGDVVGRSQTPDGVQHGFLWHRGKMTDLGLFTPQDINNRGQIVGAFDDRSGSFLWFRGKLTPLEHFVYPAAINDRGQVVGPIMIDDGPYQAALWSKGVTQTLPLYEAKDINNRGQVAGGQPSGIEGFHASVWYRGQVTDLGADAFDRSNSYLINNKGWVVGWTFDAEQFSRGALWRNGIKTDLGTLGGRNTFPTAINDHGVILVASQTADAMHPALWQGGVLTDLTQFGFGEYSGLADINNLGELAGFTRRDDGLHAAIYRPIRK